MQHIFLSQDMGFVTLRFREESRLAINHADKTETVGIGEKKCNLILNIEIFRMDWFIRAVPGIYRSQCRISSRQKKKTRNVWPGSFFLFGFFVPSIQLVGENDYEIR